MKRKLHIRAITICDDMRREDNGKEILIGVYNGIILLPRFPAALRQLCIRVEYEWTGAPKHSFKLVVTSEDGKIVLLESEGESELGNPSDPAVIGIGVGPIHFAKPTRFNIRFGVEGPPRPVGWFAVREQSPGVAST